ncbi:MAG: DNA topoisomerase VI subunit B [Candidatus Aenigmatarchaeota archaeon]
MAKGVASRPKTAEELASEMKAISISEFFEKNKHLLGFDNPTKALLMAVKEACDNSLDACEEAGILPELAVKIKQKGEDRFLVTIQDNGPGIVKEKVPQAFGKLLFGSKFHRLKQGRGQQGIGISAVVLYSQLTTGSPTKVWSKTAGSKKGTYIELLLNTQKNEPEIVKEEPWEDGFEHGVKVEFDLIGRYRSWVEDYLKQTSISNPHAKIVYTAPDGTKTTFSKTIDKLPEPPKEMKPHPYGVEYGTLQRLLTLTQSRSLAGFLTNEFSSVGAQTAKEICKVARLEPGTDPKQLGREQIEKLLGAMQKVKIQRPPTDCLSPIGKVELEKSLKSEFPGSEFIAVRSREPEVYRGFPFLVEVGIVYGGDLQTDQPIQVLRFANRVPLLHQASACATVEAAKDVDWKRYGLQQSSGQLPVGPMALVVHMCSVWVPFISEAKTAIAPYPEIVKEMKLAIQDAARELGRYLSGKRRRGEARRRFLIFERYATEVAEALSQLTKKPKSDIEKKLKSMISEKVKFDEGGETETGEEKETKQINGEKD